MTQSKNNPVFRSLDEKGEGSVSSEQVLKALAENGISTSDQRLGNLIEALSQLSSNGQFDAAAFEGLPGSGRALLEHAVRKDFVVPEFMEFGAEIRNSFDRIRKLKDGEPAAYIPQLARVKPEQFAVSVCTIDGQRLDLGDARENFTFQSSIKPMLYCAALEENGADVVHKHVGREPSGLSFNELTLNPQGRPHNPMINAGAIMSSSLIQPGKSMADRFDSLSQLIGKLAGGQAAGFDNATFHSEKETADRNFALAHYMREVGAFPEGTDIHRTLDLYFSACSLETTAESMSVIAATFANGGVCPLSDERVFAEDTIKNCLSMMYSCGMYDYSGEFAFTVGLPAKSAVSGVIMAVIPNVMGIVVWSPRLDEHGNSVRGVEFLKSLVKQFNFHNYDNLVQSTKQDPRRQPGIERLNATYSAIYAASKGDINELKRLVARGYSLETPDYDGRTPLHLAAAEGQVDAVRYLVNQGVHVNPRDRWNNTPADDAHKHRKLNVVKLLADCSPVKATQQKNVKYKAA